MKIIIPTYVEYNACQLTTSDLNNFKKFISLNAYDIQVTFREIGGRQIPIEVNFKWNPSGIDYPDIVNVKLNQYFLYESENLECYKVIDAEDISDEWYMHYEN